MISVRLIGPGRAGSSLAAALQDIGADVRGLLRRGDDLSVAAKDVDLLVIAVPDAKVASVAVAVDCVPETVVAHMSGSMGLDVLAPHMRRASIHPLVPLPNEAVGRYRLSSGATFAVEGDPIAAEVAKLLGGVAINVEGSKRAEYHTAACIASNHLVALMGQVQRVAASADLDLEPFLKLAGYALEDVSVLGPGKALTGPASRGDEETIGRHRAVLAEPELAGYDAGVELARRLSGEATKDLPNDLNKMAVPCR